MKSFYIFFFSFLLCGSLLAQETPGFKTFDNPTDNEMQVVLDKSYYDSQGNQVYGRLIVQPHSQATVYEYPLANNAVEIKNTNSEHFATLALSSEQPDTYQLDFFDMQGKRVKHVAELQPHTVKIIRNDLESGTYIVKLTNLKTQNTQGSLVVWN